MACPYFDPLEPLDPPVTRVSLGQGYAGVCGSPACGAAGTPSRETQIALCNAGYARRVCEWFPAAGEAVDAVRFSRDSQGVVIWIEEADHRPLRFGSSSEGEPLTGIRRRQMLAFARSVEEGKVR